MTQRVPNTEIFERLAKVETKVDQIMGNHLPHIEKKIDDLFDMVRQNSIDNTEDRTKIAIIIGVFLFIANLFGSILINILSGKFLL